MLKYMSKFLGLLIGLSFLAAPAFALIDGQLMIGLRNGKLKTDTTTDTLNSNEIVVAGHLDPIPLVPVAFGLALAQNTYQDKDDLKGWSSLSVIPEVMAWIPLGDFKPYGRLGYSVYSNYKGKIKGTSVVPDADVAFSGNGMRLGIGVKWSIIPLVAVLAEYNMFNESLKATKATIGGVDVKDSVGTFKTETGAILIGVEAGI